MKAERKGRLGSSFDDFLKEEGIYEAVTAAAQKRVIARRASAKQASKQKRATASARHPRGSRHGGKG
jgi:antitoxin HicB